MPLPELKATLTDIGTEELNHLEMIGAIVYQLTKDLTEDEIKKQGFEDYFVDHTTGVYPPNRQRFTLYNRIYAGKRRSNYRSPRKYGG